MAEDDISNSDSDEADRKTDQHAWQGIAEIDQAIRENRLTEYRWKKAWADPWARLGTIATLAILAAFIAFVVVSEVVF